ncbi:hypothetical protein G6F63_016148 [Rhizopus arrhizus]|nr:hypothetical protein G6F63_016148 [Rhizopus arrhizus]
MQYVQRLPPQAAVQADGDHAAHGKPAQLHRKQDDQHDAQPETGRGKAQHGKRRDRAIPPGVDLDGGHDARRHADQHGDGDAGQHQLCRYE